MKLYSQKGKIHSYTPLKSEVHILGRNENVNVKKLLQKFNEIHHLNELKKIIYQQMQFLKKYLTKSNIHS